MIFQVADVLKPEQIAQARQLLEKAEWVDGKVTAGHQSTRFKNNQQIPENHPIGKQIGEMILAALGQNQLFITAALPCKVSPPLFNRYQGGETYGTHVDNAIRQIPGTAQRMRTDISATLFLASPDEYDGGELMIEDTFGVHNVKLPAGHMILYPSGSLHQVKPVTRGARLASFFWIQSMVREDSQRTVLLDLDLAIQRLNKDYPEHPSAVQLIGVYHNLLQRWAEV
jgi:PKHD-type hydroxylase